MIDTRVAAQSRAAQHGVPGRRPSSQLRTHILSARATIAPAQVLEMLLPVVADTDTPLDVACFAALALGLVFVGSCHDDICQSVMGALMER